MRWNCFADLAVEARRDAVEEFDHRHLAAQPPPHRAQFEPDIAAADHQQALGHFVSASAPVEETICFSSMVTPGSAATSEPVAMMMCFGVEGAERAVLALDLDLAGRGDARLADNGFGLCSS